MGLSKLEINIFVKKPSVLILTVVYGPHAACSCSRLLPAEPCCLCQSCIRQRDGDSGPPAEIKYIMYRYDRRNPQSAKKFELKRVQSHVYQGTDSFVPAVVIRGVDGAVR